LVPEKSPLLVLNNKTAATVAKNMTTELAFVPGAFFIEFMI
jgi:hypothetical protein